MSYFRELPNLQYQSFLSDKKSSSDYLLVKNLFRRVKLRDDLQNVFTIFDKYQIPDGSRPELVAEELYGSVQYDWVVLVTAGITNVRDQWPLSDKQVYDYAEELYGEDLTAIHHYETTEVRDSQDRLILPAGKVVDADFTFVYSDVDQNYYSNDLDRISYSETCAENATAGSILIKSSESEIINLNDRLAINGTYIPIVSIEDGTTVVSITTSFVSAAIISNGDIGITTTTITGITTNATGSSIVVGQTIQESEGIIGPDTVVTGIGQQTVYLNQATQNQVSLNNVELSFGNFVTTVISENTKNIVLSSEIPVDIPRGADLTFKVDNTSLIQTNPVIGITNYEYEVRKNNEKRSIYVLKPRYLQQVLLDTRREMNYDKSSQYVDNRTIKTENTRIVSP